MDRLICNYAHSSWKELLEDKKEELENIDSFLSMQTRMYNPLNENILRFLKNDLKNLKVVIIGQDTYPEQGKATGRAFETMGLDSWNSKFRQVSLKNIVRNLYGTYTGESPYTSYEEIKKKIATKEFEITPPNQIFDKWESQGVLLLNGALTCEVGKPGSHSAIWEDFIIETVKYINKNNPDVLFFLWGSYANKFAKYTTYNLISRHPMMCSKSYNDDFLKNQCFKVTKDSINWI